MIGFWRSCLVPLTKGTCRLFKVCEGGSLKLANDLSVRRIAVGILLVTVKFYKVDSVHLYLITINSNSVSLIDIVCLKHRLNTLDGEMINELININTY